MLAHMVKTHTYIMMISMGSIRALLLASFVLTAGMARAAEFGDKRDKPGEVQAMQVEPLCVQDPEPFQAR